MKIHNFTLASLVLGLTLSLASAAEAREHRTRTDSIATTSAYSESGGSSNFGIGLSTYPGVGTGSIAGLLELGNRHAIQFNLAIPTTSPFTFIGGGLYKYSIMESQGMGFHIGGGGFFGSVTSNFYMQAGGVAGFHFNFPGTNNKIALHLDGGPVVTIANGGSATFGISPFSSLVGLSAFYMF